MAQTEGMAKLVCSDLEEIGTAGAVDGPLFVIVEMGIATVNGEVSVSQGASRSIEGITVTVFSFLELDLDVNLNIVSRSVLKFSTTR